MINQLKLTLDNPKLKMKLIFRVGLLLFITTNFVVSQGNIEWKKSNFPGKEKEFNKAFKAFKDGDKLYYKGPPYYEEALVKFSEAIAFNPNNDYLNFHMGHIYFALHQPKQAEVYFEKAIALNPNLKEQILYELAVSYHQDGDWDEAINHYNQYKKFISEGGHQHLEMHESEIPRELKYIDLCIRQCETGKILSHDTVPIIFENLSAGINTKYPEYSPVTNHNEDLLIFVSRRPTNTGNKKHHGLAFEYEDVYYSKRGVNGWEEAKHIHGNVNTHTHEAPVWVSGDGKRLLLYYNKSRKKNIDMQGDVYESYFENDEWSKPKPLKMVNSKWRETHASISNDGNTIYFTTNNPKWAKHGGMDIVKTTYDPATDTWSEPVDIGGTINTEWDEESPFIKPDGKHFYFSSQGHTSVGGFDFFKCLIDSTGNFTEPVNMGFPLNTTYDDPFIYVSDDGKRVFFNSDRIGGNGSTDIYEGFILSEIDIPVEIYVKDAETSEDIEGANIKLTETEGRPYFKEVVAANKGIYLVYVGVQKVYHADVNAEGYIPQTKSFNTLYDKIFNFDTTVIKLYVYLEKDKEQVPIVFSGQLFDEKTKLPIDGDVIIFEGERQIAHVKTEKSIFKVDLKTNVKYNLTASSSGYQSEKDEFTPSKTNTKKDIYLDKAEYAGGFEVKNIYYETAKYNIRPQFVKDLVDVLAHMKQYPNIKLEVTGHTDWVGTNESNITLSINRAKSVQKWLMARGISEDRIILKWFGEESPIADNTTDEGRTLNRRSELRIVK